MRRKFSPLSFERESVEKKRKEGKRGWWRPRSYDLPHTRDENRKSEKNAVNLRARTMRPRVGSARRWTRGSLAPPPLRGQWDYALLARAYALSTASSVPVLAVIRSDWKASLPVYLLLLFTFFTYRRRYFVTFHFHPCEITCSSVSLW